MAPKTRKRKRIDDKSSPSNINLDIFVTQLKINATEPSLLDFAPEIRNLIYEKVIEDTEVTLHRSTSRPLACSSALARVNKQVRSEFMSVALLTADISTIVRDFSFSHIVTFLNRLSETELQAISQVDVPSKRTITIKLELSQLIGCGSRYQDSLRRWINRAAHPCKKGTSIDFQYLDLDKSHQDTRDFLASSCHVFSDLLRWTSDRSHEEMLKVALALYGTKPVRCTMS